MPTYDYRCRSCGNVTEVIHAMREDGPTTCELCGGQLRRVLFPSGIIFKGAGFYRNDSRPSTSGSDSGSEKPAAPASDGASTSTKTEKTEKKPDSTGSTKPASSD